MYSFAGHPVAVVGNNIAVVSNNIAVVGNNIAVLGNKIAVVGNKLLLFKILLSAWPCRLNLQLEYHAELYIIDSCIENQ